MAEDLIRYDVLVQDALRGVVRKVLTEVSKAGLPGDHHFYIAFDTTAPGVRISSRLREKYPNEMTIVLQHQFWELTVTEQAVEVGLSFGGAAEKLFVPFTAIKGFFDPSVQFGLQFEPEKSGQQQAAGPKVGMGEPGEFTEIAQPLPATEQDLKGPEPDTAAAEADNAEKASESTDDDAAGGDADDAAGADVVSLDSFRKKS